MTNLLKEELTLRIDRELRYRMDPVIARLTKMAQEFNIGQDKSNSRSSLRNILLVASDPATSFEALKVYIRYQSARDIKILKIKPKDQRFADVLIAELEKLKEDAKMIFEHVRRSLPDKHPLIHYFNESQYERDLQDLHFKLVQLYLGSLVREHVALIDIAKEGNERNENRGNQGNLSNKAIERPTRKRS